MTYITTENTYSYNVQRRKRDTLNNIHIKNTVYLQKLNDYFSTVAERLREKQ